MSSRSDQHAEETYRDEDERRYDDDPYADEAGDGRFSYLPSWGWGGAWGVVPFGLRDDETATGYDDERRDDERHEEAGYDPYGEEEVGESGSGRLWDEGLITLLIVGGAILFLIPEPATSGLGVLLMGIGVLAWLVDWVTG